MKLECFFFVIVGTGVNELWLFDFDLQKWFYINGEAFESPSFINDSQPVSRFAHSIAIEQSTGQLFVFGGNGHIFDNMTTRNLNDLWAYSISLNCNTGYQMNEQGTKCVLCGPGTFKSESGTTNCKSCPSNAICEPTNFACQIGYELASDKSSCSACSSSTEKLLPGNFACTPLTTVNPSTLFTTSTIITLSLTLSVIFIFVFGFYAGFMFEGGRTKAYASGSISVTSHSRNPLVVQSRRPFKASSDTDQRRHLLMNRSIPTSERPQRHLSQPRSNFMKQQAK